MTIVPSAFAASMSDTPAPHVQPSAELEQVIEINLVNRIISEYDIVLR